MMLHPIYKIEARSRKMGWEWPFSPSLIDIVIILQKAMFILFGPNSI